MFPAPMNPIVAMAVTISLCRTRPRCGDALYPASRNSGSQWRAPARGTPAWRPPFLARGGCTVPRQRRERGERKRMRGQKRPYPCWQMGLVGHGRGDRISGELAMRDGRRAQQGARGTATHLMVARASVQIAGRAGAGNQAGNHQERCDLRVGQHWATRRGVRLNGHVASFTSSSRPLGERPIRSVIGGPHRPESAGSHLPEHCRSS